MKFWNLHCHTIEIFVVKKKPYKELSISKYSKSEIKKKSANNIFALKCRDCEEFNYD